MIIKIFYSNNCSHCVSLKKSLDKLGIQYVALNVENEENKNLLKKISKSNVIPTTLLENQDISTIIVGNNPMAIKYFSEFKNDDSKIKEQANYPTDLDGNRLCSSYGKNWKQGTSPKCCYLDSQCRGCFVGNKLQHCFRTT